MTVTLDLRLVMVSDWHVGTGTAAHGYVNRLVQRDDGLPFVPAKTLNGVWRDACEVAAHALDSGPAGIWHDWVEDLFGGQPSLTTGPVPRPPRPARLRFHGPLRMPAPVAEVLCGRPFLQEATTFHKPGVKIDVATGAAADDMLRVEEMARAGAELSGEVEIAGLDDEQRVAALALLSAGARLVESIGGKRRRGAGRCRLSVEPPGPLPDDSILTVAPPAPPDPAVVSAVVETAASTSNVTPNAGWEEAVLTLTTLTPVLAHDRTLGNFVQGLDHLPGWVLLPAVLSRLRGLGGGQAAALARRGDLIVTAATPGLPVPRVFIADKNDRTRVIANRLAGQADRGKQCREGYVDAESPPRLTRPERVVRMHNSIRDDIQRPAEDIGGVYVYAALAKDTRLRAHVRVRAGALSPAWEQRLGGTWRIGRSAKDDYGLVEVTVDTVRTVPADVEREAGLLRVWLQSDLLVRDVRLRPSTDIDDVARALERALTAAGAQDVRIEPVTSETAIGAHRVDNWHRGWGLPRPTLLGLAAGSCLTFRVREGTIPPSALGEVEAAGIGERRGEGFGQVLVNHELLDREITDPAPVTRAGRNDEDPPREEAGQNTVPSLSAAEREAVRVFEIAAWRQAIYRACEGLAADTGRRNDLLPAGATMTRLNAVRRLPLAPSEDQVAAWLARLRESSGVFKEATEPIKRLLTESDEVWRLLALPEAELTATADGATELKERLHGEAVRAVLSSCLSAHAREAGTAVKNGPRKKSQKTKQAGGGRFNQKERDRR